MTIAQAASLPSRYAIGDAVYFHPVIHDYTADQIKKYALKAKIVAIAFSESKVLYDLALDTAVDPGPAEYYDAIPVADVDSYFVLNEADALDEDRLRADVSWKATASAGVPRTPDETRRFVQYFQTIAADLPMLRQELGKNV